MVTLTVSSDCFIEHPGRTLEKALKERLTIDNPKYIAARRYGRWIGKRLKPKLSYFESVPGGIHFPRGYSNQAVLLCREITGTEPEIIDNRRLLENHRFGFSGTLREYQQKIVDYTV